VFLTVLFGLKNTVLDGTSRACGLVSHRSQQPEHRHTHHNRHPQLPGKPRSNTSKDSGNHAFKPFTTIPSTVSSSFNSSLTLEAPVSVATTSHHHPKR
jgi:hypothetical protein